MNKLVNSENKGKGEIDYWLFFIVLFYKNAEFYYGWIKVQNSTTRFFYYITAFYTKMTE